MAHTSTTPSDTIRGHWDHVSPKGYEFSSIHQTISDEDMAQTEAEIEFYAAEDAKDARHDDEPDIAGEEEYDAQEAYYASR